MLESNKCRQSIENMAPLCHPRIPTLEEYYKEMNSHTGSISSMSADHHIQKSGLLFIQGNNQKKMAVRAKVYNNKLDHYILLSSKSLNNSNQKFINLRNTHVVQEGDNSIRVTPNKDVDGQSLLFIVSNTKDLSSWLEVLGSSTGSSSPKLCQQTLLMPILVESDEE